MKNTILAFLEENAGRTPDKTAVADEFRSLTWRGYLAAALRAAGRIREMTGGDFLQAGSRPVGVLIDRNIISVAAFIGIAYSGNFYVPLDPALPAGRLEMILRELSPVMLVDAREPAEASGQTADSMKASAPAGNAVLAADARPQAPARPLPVACNVPVLDMYAICADLFTERTGDTENPAAGALNASGDAGNAAGADVNSAADQAVQALIRDAQAMRSGLIDTDPLYAIFTSGSTGVPKGVLVSHRSVLDLTEAFGETFGFAEDAVFGNQAPFDFDVSVKDIYNAMHCGGRVEVVPHRMFVMPAMLMEYLASHGINTIIWAVSALRIVSDLKALDQMQTSVPVDLRHIMFSGEVMPVKSINYWIRFFPDAVYVNLYGPTEITCNCTYHILDRHYENDELIPIGKSFPNKRVFLLERPEEDGDSEAEAPAVPRIIPVTEPDCRGEICVEGTGVALGYWNNPARTAESFTARPGAPATLNRIYRTGDLGYYNKDGDLMFAARADNQIKHMGHRIELGEIEAALNAIDFIDVACCFYDQKKEKIICVYQAEEDRRKQIIQALSDRLPKYMRPNRYLRMEQMPLNAHAKIDRRLLRTMYEEGRI